MCTGKVKEKKRAEHRGKEESREKGRGRLMVEYCQKEGKIPGKEIKKVEYKEKEENKGWSTGSTNKREGAD